MSLPCYFKLQPPLVNLYFNALSSRHSFSHPRHLQGKMPKATQAHHLQNMSISDMLISPISFFCVTHHLLILSLKISVLTSITHLIFSPYPIRSHCSSFHSLFPFKSSLNSHFSLCLFLSMPSLPLIRRIEKLSNASLFPIYLIQG